MEREGSQMIIKNIDRDTFKRALETIKVAVSSKSTLPILSNILLKAEKTEQGGTLRLAATNLELGILLTSEMEVMLSGDTTLPAKLLFDVVACMSDPVFDLTLNGDTAILLSKSGKTTIKGLPASEFPSFESNGAGERVMLIEAEVLKEAARRVCFSAATDGTRPIFGGVLCVLGTDAVTFATADSYRLSEQKSKAEVTNGHAGRTLLIPSKSLAQVAQILPDTGTIAICLSQDQNRIIFTAPGLEVVSRLIDGQYPNYTQIIPKSATTTAIINGAELRACAKSAALFALDGSHIARFTITPGENSEPGKVCIRATSDGRGDIETTLNALVEGPEKTIVFNISYFSELMNVLTETEISFAMTEGNQPATLRPVGNGTYLHVMMPMHIVR